MNTAELTDKQLIELYTAEGFLALYNAQRQANYVVRRVANDGEVPDVLAEDELGSQLGIEVTLIQDRPRDIAAALGRSDHRLRKERRAHPVLASVLQGNVLSGLVERIDNKLNMRYGPNVALVIRETSIPWEWASVLPDLQSYLSERTVPFERGIWLLSRCRGILTPVYRELA